MARAVREYVGGKRDLEDAMKGLQTWLAGRRSASERSFGAGLTPLLLAGLLAGRADVQADVAGEDLAGGGDVVLANAAEDAGAFTVRFREAIDFLRSKKVVDDEEFERLSRAAQARAFKVAGLSDRYVLETMKASLQAAMEKGETINGWLGGLEETLGNAGLGGAAENSWHMRLVARQNLYTAYSAGRWQQMRKVRQARPYLQYVTVGDDRVRPEHAALDGVIKRADDPWWRKYYPPNGWGCRCLAVSLSEDELQAEGLKVTSDEEIAETYAGLVPSSGGAMPAVDARFVGDPDELFRLEDAA
jgi:SPP1 gp7 family putative phage head morphogenesis protein